MNAKSKADFINSVADRKIVPCQTCGTGNEPDKKFCIFCGAELITVTKNGSVPVSGVDKSEQKNEKDKKYVSSVSVFADGLPSWDIVPPILMVRR